MKFFTSFFILSLSVAESLMAQDVLASIRKEGFTAFADAVEKAGLKYAVESRATSAVTILVPNNAAFEAIKSVVDGLNQIQLQHVLATHVIPAGAFKSTDLKSGTVETVNSLQKLDVVVNADGVSFNGTKVIKADNTLNNGVYHVIDKVIVPAHLGSTPIVSNIVDTAKGANLTSLLGALEKADLVKTIQDAKDITVFAPTNEAFAAIKSTTDKLTVDELKDILLLHVTPAVYYSKRLSDATVKTLNPKENLTVKVSGGKITVNGVAVVIADVPTTQGMVHVVEKVILPGSSTDNKTNVTSSGFRLLATIGMAALPAMMIML